MNSFMNVTAIQLFVDGLIDHDYVNALLYPNLVDVIEATLIDYQLRRVRYQGTGAQREMVYELPCNFDLSDHLI